MPCDFIQAQAASRGHSTASEELTSPNHSPNVDLDAVQHKVSDLPLSRTHTEYLRKEMAT